MLLAQQVLRKEKQVKKLKREVRRVRQESEMAANEMQPQLRKLVDLVKDSKVCDPLLVQGWTLGGLSQCVYGGGNECAYVCFVELTSTALKG